MLSLGEDD